MEVSPSTTSNTYYQSDLQKTESKYAADEVNQKLKASGKNYRPTMDQNDFIKLMVKEMQFQDPLNPMDNKEFISQMARFSTLEQSTKTNKALEQLISITTRQDTYAMLGKKVTWINEVTGSKNSGIVESVVKSGQFTMLKVGEKMINPDSIVSVELDLYQNNNTNIVPSKEKILDAYNILDKSASFESIKRNTVNRE